MKKLLSVLLAAMLAAMLLIVLTAAGIAETVAEPPAPVFTVNVTQLVIAIMGVVFNILLAWIIKAVIPPLNPDLPHKIHSTILVAMNNLICAKLRGLSSELLRVIQSVSACFALACARTLAFLTALSSGVSAALAALRLALFLSYISLLCSGVRLANRWAALMRFLSRFSSTVMGGFLGWRVLPCSASLRS